jgi:hypothetical protein
MKPGKIEIKDTDVLDGLMKKRFNNKLIKIIKWVAVIYGVIITESYRKKRHANDLHGEDPVRAIDIRSWCYSKTLAEKICSEINKRWIYDPSRPDMVVAKIHNVGNGIHFHIQVHPNTVEVN